MSYEFNSNDYQSNESSMLSEYGHKDVYLSANSTYSTLFKHLPKWSESEYKSESEIGQVSCVDKLINMFWSSESESESISKLKQNIDDLKDDINRLKKDLELLNYNTYNKYFRHTNFRTHMRRYPSGTNIIEQLLKDQTPITMISKIFIKIDHFSELDKILFTLGHVQLSFTNHQLCMFDRLYRNIITSTSEGYIIELPLWFSQEKHHLPIFPKTNNNIEVSFTQGTQSAEIIVYGQELDRNELCQTWGQLFHKCDEKVIDIQREYTFQFDHVDQNLLKTTTIPNHLMVKEFIVTYFDFNGNIFTPAKNITVSYGDRHQTYDRLQCTYLNQLVYHEEFTPHHPQYYVISQCLNPLLMGQPTGSFGGQSLEIVLKHELETFDVSKISIVVTGFNVLRRVQEQYGLAYDFTP